MPLTGVINYVFCIYYNNNKHPDTGRWIHRDSWDHLGCAISCEQASRPTMLHSESLGSGIPPGSTF